MVYNKFMSEDQFTKLYKYIQKGFSDVDRRFDKIETRFDGRFDQLNNIIDDYADKTGVDLDKIHA